MGLSAPDLLGMQQALAGELTTSAQIQRVVRTSDGAGGVTETWSTIATVNCNASPLSKQETEIPELGRLEGQSQWLVTLPPYTDVTVLDRIVTQGLTYEVYAVKGPRTYEIYRSVLTWLIQ